MAAFHGQLETKKEKVESPVIMWSGKARPVGFLYFLLSEPFDRIRRLG